MLNLGVNVDRERVKQHNCINGRRREYRIQEGGKDMQRNRQSVTSKTQSKPYKSEKSYSPKGETERAEAESVPNWSPKRALTSCHPSSCCPSTFPSSTCLRPCLCLFCPWRERPRWLWLVWPFCFQ